MVVCYTMLSKVFIKLTLITLLFISPSPHPSTAGLPQVKQVATNTVSLTLTGYAVDGWIGSGQSNPTITVNQGDTVSLTLSSGDRMLHLFYVDVNGNMMPDCTTVDPCSKMVPPTTTLTLTVSLAPGTYTYYCFFHQFYMHGTFVVNPPASFVRGKLSWTHHLSLTKENGMQTFTAHILDTGSATTTAIVHVTGSSTAGPFTATSAATLLQPGTVTSIPFSSTVTPSFQDTKVCFTATLTFGPTGTENTSPTTKSGCFAVTS